MLFSQFGGLDRNPAVGEARGLSGISSVFAYFFRTRSKIWGKYEEFSSNLDEDC